MTRAKKITAQDVARASGVSATSVSFILNGRTDVSISAPTRQRVTETAQRLGYRPNGLAAALRTGRLYTVGLVCPFALTDDAAGGHFYHRELLLALSAAAARAGMNAVLFVDKPLSEIPPENMADRRVDGAVFICLYGCQDWVKAVYDTGLPCVELGSRYGRYHVRADNRAAARLATEHLIGLGHRRIGHWRGPYPYDSAQARHQGFLEAMKAAFPDGAATAPVVQTADEFALLLRAPDCPTGFFLFNDERAVTALDLIHSAGRHVVPRDISLVGFDNDIRATLTRPRLTTVQNPLKEVATAAIALLQAQIQGKDPENDPPLIPAHLVVRDSTAAAPPPL